MKIGWSELFRVIPALTIVTFRRVCFVNIQKSFFIFAAGAIGLGCYPAIASSDEPGTVRAECSLKFFKSPTRQAADNELKKTFRCSKTLDKGYMDVRFSVGEDGRVYDPEITHYSGNDQYNAECFEAICGLQYLPAYKSSRMHLDHISKRFGEYGLVGANAPEIAEFIKTHPLKTGAVVVHKIPLSFLSRYPGLFTLEELTSPSNLMVIEQTPEYMDDVNKEGPRYSVPTFVSALTRMNGIYRQVLEVQKPVTRKYILERASEMPHEAIQ